MLRARRWCALLPLAAWHAEAAPPKWTPEGGGAGRGRLPRAYGDTFVEASIGDIGYLIPTLASDAPPTRVGGWPVYDSLVRLDKNLNNAPAMAESWTFSEDCLTLETSSCGGT